jgi:hypothetical protein
MKDKLETFERAFADSTAGCVRECDCGRVFYDGYNSYDWEEGEKERLKADKSATRVEYSVGDISFDGGQYVDACDCWHKKAESLMAWLDSHAHKCAKYLNLEKKRLQRLADRAPTVEE